MRVYGLIGAVALCLTGLPLHAQQGEPGTGSTQIAPASQAPKTVQAPNVRVDSKPHTDLDPSMDSAPEPIDMGLGVTAAPDLGPDLLPAIPPGMIASAVPGNPRMRYYSLPHRSGDEISAGDRQIINERKPDLGRAADSQAYEQGVCPAMQPNAEAKTGVPPGGDGQGFILLHTSSDDGNRRHAEATTAVIPRVASLPVREISTPQPRLGKKPKKALNRKGARTAVNEALPPSTLYASLQPTGDWIATSACLAELGGATVQIPDQPDLGENIVTAPSPMLKLKLDGSREVIFSDRVDEGRYVIWDATVSPRGSMKGAEQQAVAIKPLAILNPPVPQPRLLSDIPDPPMHITPAPPSPISGDHQ